MCCFLFTTSQRQSSVRFCPLLSIQCGSNPWHASTGRVQNRSLTPSVVTQHVLVTLCPCVFIPLSPIGLKAHPTLVTTLLPNKNTLWGFWKDVNLERTPSSQQWHPKWCGWEIQSIEVCWEAEIYRELKLFTLASHCAGFLFQACWSLDGYAVECVYFWELAQSTGVQALEWCESNDATFGISHFDLCNHLIALGDLSLSNIQAHSCLECTGANGITG